MKRCLSLILTHYLGRVSHVNTVLPFMYFQHTCRRTNEAIVSCLFLRNSGSLRKINFRQRTTRRLLELPAAPHPRNPSLGRRSGEKFKASNSFPLKCLPLLASRAAEALLSFRRTEGYSYCLTNLDGRKHAHKLMRFGKNPQQSPSWAKYFFS